MITVSTTQTRHQFEVPVFSMSGVVDVDDSQVLLQLLNEGGVFHRRALLGELEIGTEVPAESRKLLAALHLQQQPVAVVTTSVGMRLLVQFMRQVIGISHLKMFPTREEALKWLDEQLLEQGPPPTPSGPGSVPHARTA